MEHEEFSVTQPSSTNGTAPLTRLCALDTLFSATGTVEVKVGSKTIPIPIQSVDVEAVQALAGKPPRAPMYQERRDGIMTRVRDVADPTYMDNLERHNRDTMTIWICSAIAIDIANKHGTVMWSADNTVHDLVGARVALKEMGLNDAQLLAVFNGCRALTDSAQQVISQD
jgi:hypothetical protein